MVDILSRILRRSPKGADILSVANAALEETEALGQTMTLMRLQRIVHLAHGFMLTTCDRPLHSARTVVLGGTPSTNEIYAAFRRFGAQPVTQPASIPGLPGYAMPADADEDRRAVLRATLNAYAPFIDYRLGVAVRGLYGPLSEGQVLSDAEVAAAFRRRQAQTDGLRAA